MACLAYHTIPLLEVQPLPTRSNAPLKGAMRRYLGIHARRHDDIHHALRTRQYALHAQPIGLVGMRDGERSLRISGRASLKVPGVATDSLGGSNK